MVWDIRKSFLSWKEITWPPYLTYRWPSKHFYSKKRSLDVLIIMIQPSVTWLRLFASPLSNVIYVHQPSFHYIHRIVYGIIQLVRTHQSGKSLTPLPHCTHMYPVYARKKLVQARQFALASLSARVIALNYLDFCAWAPRFVFPKYKVFWCWTISNFLFRKKQDKAKLWKQKVTVVSVAAATTKFLFGVCDCTVDINVGTGDFSFVLGILHVCGYVHVRSHVSRGMDCVRLLRYPPPPLRTYSFTYDPLHS